MLNVYKHIGAFQQGFGGDAPPVEANPAKGFAFNDGCFQAEL